MALLYRMGTGNGSGGDLKPYIVNFTCDSGFVGKTLAMEYLGTPHAGETVDNVSGTVASDGALTLYPMHDGLWKYYATSDLSGYQEGTITLEKWGNYPVELKDTLDGATVTPIDDVQTWLHCANIWDKTDITTIAEVIADTTTLNILLANENANNYLVRSTSFATDLCSNETAMTYIGLNDYCANKLLADSTWLEAICNSPYFEKVIYALVNPMESNTASDGGEAICSTASGTNWEAYKAYDNDLSTWWSSQQLASVGSYIGYGFVNPTCVKKVKYTSFSDPSAVYNPVSVSIEGANDKNGEWTKIPNLEGEVNQTLNLTPDKTITELPLNNNTYYKYYRIYYNGKCSSDNYDNCREIQFYGREEA